MKYYLGLILFFLFGCASQKSPTGGPVDVQGPSFIQSSPSTSQLLAKNDKIILFFDEKINPISVVNSIDILNFDEFNYKIRGNNGSGPVLVLSNELCIARNVLSKVTAHQASIGIIPTTRTRAYNNL